MALPVKQRIAYIDWMRGLACVLMFQTHCYDSWLSPAARKTNFFGWSQLLGTLPAPLFLFLAGISFALVTDRMRQKGVSANEIAATTIRRGAEILGLGLLFRVQEFALGYPWSPWTDLLRVDILNTIGVSMMLMGVVCRFAQRRPTNATLAGAVAAGIALATPPLWTTWQPRWLPWPIESYINGVHNLGTPQHWLFPIFPWAAFAFAGLASGFFLLSDWARARQGQAVLILGGAGAICGALGWWFDSLPVHMYAVYDFWHTSPNFLLIRVGVVMLIVPLVYAWCRWGAAQWGFSPIIKMGQASLLVYWVHIEFVYGRFSILTKRGESIAMASLG
ncbi:MAG: heparan-alpha-glucosaminide N-acetyltransferase domain-containing protein, partial [Candidatus Acidiferrales bacterium]